MKKILHYLKIWWMLTKTSFLTVLSQKLGFGIFLFGKIFRFGFLYLFLIFLLKGTQSLAGYNLNETLLFFLTFTLIDTISQFLYREVYRFRPQVVSGAFDLTLSKPINALFKSLMSGADIIDLVFLPIIIAATFIVGSRLSPDLPDIFLYFLLLANGLLIATAFHIFVLALGILTLEIDHTIMIYRDIVSLGRFPIDIYKEPLKSALTFLIPVAVMFTFPAQAVIGLLNFQGILIALGVGFLFTVASLKFWKFALKYYTSASS